MTRLIKFNTVLENNVGVQSKSVFTVLLVTQLTSSRTNTDVNNV